MDTAFTKLGLSDALAYAVQEMGYVDPTPIQQQAIPVVLAGGDVIGSAQTGTGKTAAFALPIIQRLSTHGSLRCLILEPTRELALQVEEAFQKFAKFTDLRVTIVYGGVGYGKQLTDLKRGMDILAATPGRLLDHLEQGNCSLDHIDILVLDEVDRMLDMGFLPDVKRIVQRCPAGRQTLFFTATLPPEIEQLAGWALRNPTKVEIGRQRSPAETIAHAFYPVVAAQKFDLLQLLLEKTEFKSVLIFCRTRMGADRIASRLQAKGHTVGVLHSDRSQRERVEALDGFKSGKFEVLVATDIAARGLDIAGVTHVPRTTSTASVAPGERSPPATRSPSSPKTMCATPAASNDSSAPRSNARRSRDSSTSTPPSSTRRPLPMPSQRRHRADCTAACGAELLRFSRAYESVVAASAALSSRLGGCSWPMNGRIDSYPHRSVLGPSVHSVIVLRSHFSIFVK
jgi:ATP-dependent RNA helicase RhlE